MDPSVSSELCASRAGQDWHVNTGTNRPNSSDSFSTLNSRGIRRTVQNYSGRDTINICETRDQFCE